MKNKITSVALILFSITTKVNATCPVLTADLAKNHDIDCERKAHVNEGMVADKLSMAQETHNTCWTTFQAKSLSELLEMRKLEIAGKEELTDPLFCTYQRLDSTTYVYLEILKSELQ